MRTFALIPAAGKSRRMGRAKLLLPLGDATVLERVVASVRAAGVHDILVVVAPGADDLARLAAGAGAEVLLLERDTPDMRSTCEHGLAWLETRFSPHADDRWLLLPADHPTVRPDVVRALLTAADAHRDSTIFVPIHMGRRGHPTLLRWSHVNAIRALPADEGLNQFIRSCGAETFELAWPSDEVVRDLDTPADYERMVAENSLKPIRGQ